jgi:hypothetical protein
MDDIKLSALLKNPASKGGYRIHPRDLHHFVQVPWKIPAYYDSCSKKVFPLYLQELSDLNPDPSGIKKFFPGSHPFFRHLSFLQYFLAWKNHQLAGRVAVYIDENYHESEVKGSIGWIGLFECIECKETAEKLIGEAIKTLKQQGVTKIIGPARFNANGEIGLLIDGFQHHPMFMEPYHPPYYQKYFEAFGQKENDWYAFLVKTSSMKAFIERINSLGSKGKSLRHKIAAQGIQIRSLSRQHFSKDVMAIKHLYNQAWDTDRHPQFEYFDDAEFNYIAQGLKMMALYEWVLLAEKQLSTEKEIVACSVMIPDLNEVIEEWDQDHKTWMTSSARIPIWKWLWRDVMIFRRLKKRLKVKVFNNARIFILGSLSKKNGLDALLYLESYELAKIYGLETGSGSQIADINLEMINPMKRMADITFTWRVYRFSL